MNTSRRTVAAAAAGALALTLSACVKTSEEAAESAGTSGSAKGSATTLYNDPEAEPNLDLPANPRVVALGWSDGEIAVSLGVKPVAIYDWMAFGAKTKGVGSWASDKFGDSKPKIISAQSAGKFNYQQIKELKPDVILNVRGASDDKVQRSLRKIAPVVAAPKGAPDFAVNWKTQTTLIGKALGKGQDATKLVSQTTGAQDKIKKDHPEFAGKTFVYGAKFGEAYGAYTEGDARFDTFATLGFTQNPPVEQLKSSGFFAAVPTEKVKSLDAEVAILTTIGKPLSELKSDKSINSLGVVRDDRAVMLDGMDPSMQAMSAGTPLSLQFALKELTPKLSAAAKK
ncbi:ABC transporter substrate-binding protein [Demetria terragena]|uniref:ABC transporter substrate-binding protein n=1 Tax=Demetria terragena TaxID=63959 RepID=UPI00058B011F|nr:ABC transporter substrate-binding protein [Demetria terragena]